MYYAHFGLKEPPFKITPNTEFFFSGGNRGAVLDALVYAITSGEGIVKVVGEVGSGKTMLCRMLEGMLPENVERVYLANPSVAPEDILHAIAFELQLALPPEADRLLVMQTLHNHLIARHTEGRQVVIFVEEAQGMPLATLEEIRLLSNLETRHSKLLQIVLFGQPELDVNLNQQHIRQLKERITHSFDLGPLNEKDIEDYLISRLRTAGYFGPPLFTKKAVKLMTKASKGLVRRVNILADKSLLAAFAENAYAITPKHVGIAIKDSEFGAEDTPQSSSKTAYWLAATGLALGLGIGFGTPLIKPFFQPTTTPVATKVQTPAPTQEKSKDEKPSAPEPKSSTAPPQEAGGFTPETTSPEPAPIKTEPAPPANIIEARLLATQTWLAQQSPSTVSIQLMVGDNPEQMRRQLENLTTLVEIDNLFVYRTNVGGKPYISVLYGSFADRATASKTLSELPKPLRTYKPQLRTVGGITEEIKQLQ
ncbi:MAG: AAA family ATPase [Methylophilales bacterium]|nr:AAA family ATPase [Methylophilales bacterium]